MNDLIKPKEIQITDMDGGIHTYVISRLPYPVGREVAAVYPVSNMPKVGDYKASEAIMLKLMKYVAKQPEDSDMIRLTNMDLISNHVPDTTVGLKLEAAMLAFNFDFFGQGGISAFLKRFSETRLPSIIKTLIPLLPPSLVQEFADGLKSTLGATSKTS
jgi:hypothetical protein